MTMLQRSTALITILALTSSLAPAQFSVFPDKSYWREMWQAPPSAVEIESVSKLEDYVIDGKVQLSLKAYVELVMANSPDINLQKLSVYEQQNAIASALSPFDPSFTATFNTQRATTPSNTVLQGASILSNLSQVGRATYNQTFDTGTQFQTSYSTNRSSNNSSFTTFNPSVTQGLQVQLTQPLLRDRGRGVQRLPFLIAETRLDQTHAQVQQQIIQLLFQAESA
ncbi:MAG: hypothetical protein KDG44_04955, partial [Burkholderiaceae bacterium]|nr:hypothetical protein [Burkholderiaceae bacterium]